MSPSGVDKGELSAEQILLVDEHARIVNGNGKPSDETLLHLEIVKQRQAGAVLHTHSVWNNIFSDLFADEHGFAIEGYEMLKGLAGVTTHEHREWLPIIENSQDMRELAAKISAVLTEQPNAHGFFYINTAFIRGENICARPGDILRSWNFCSRLVVEPCSLKDEETDYGSTHDLRSESNVA